MGKKLDYVFYAFRIPQAILIFPFIIVNASNTTRFNRPAIGHITAISSIFWIFLDMFLDKFRPSAAGRKPRPNLGTVAHEATLFGFWIASSILAGESHNGAGVGLAATECALFGITIILNLVQIKLAHKKEKESPLSVQSDDFPSMNVRLTAEAQKPKKVAEEEREPRESEDSGFGGLKGLEEGRSLLK